MIVDSYELVEFSPPILINNLVISTPPNSGLTFRSSLRTRLRLLEEVKRAVFDLGMRKERGV